MNDKISYHNWNDGINLWEIKIKKIEIKKTQSDFNLMKKILKNEIIYKLDNSMLEINTILKKY